MWERIFWVHKCLGTHTAGVLDTAYWILFEIEHGKKIYMSFREMYFNIEGDAITFISLKKLPDSC